MSDYGAGAATQHTGSQQAANTEPLSTAEFLLDARAVIATIETVIDGKRSVIQTALTVLLAEGHLLIEDVPGVGKTMLARALARSVDCTVQRIQFTPDLLPADITGVSVFNQSDGEFEFKPGPVFANIVIGDEINRASRRPSRALLESMEERQVTVDGTTYTLADPFTVSRPRTRSRWRAPTRCPRLSATGSWRASRWDTPIQSPRSRCCALVRRQPARRARARSSASNELRAMIATARARLVSPAVEQYAVAIAPPPASTANCGSARARGQPCSWCGPRRRAPRSTDATSCFPTTSMRSPSRCCRTAHPESFGSERRPRRGGPRRHHIAHRGEHARAARCLRRGLGADGPRREEAAGCRPGTRRNPRPQDDKAHPPDLARDRVIPARQRWRSCSPTASAAASTSSSASSRPCCRSRDCSTCGCAGPSSR